MPSNIKPIILCGGSGTRLWPLSRESFPKQFVPLVHGQSLLELTVERVRGWLSPTCITNEAHRFLVKDMLGGEAAIILEPAGRNTAAAMTCAALMPGLAATDLLLFLPSDHYVPDIQTFQATIESGILAAESGYIVTFGVQPSFPSTAYGYIQWDREAPVGDDGVAHRVKRFVEKPNLAVAQEMVLSTEYWWNAGIFLCQAGVLLEALSLHAPDILSACQKAAQGFNTDGHFLRPDHDSFLACRSESIDYAVMERFDRVAVIPFKGAWSDVGSWGAVAQLAPADISGNRIQGLGVAHLADNTYINAPIRPVVALGTSNLLIIDTSDAVLVASQDHAERVKDVVALLKNQEVAEAVTHRKVPRPWGWYDSIDAGDSFKVKRICVKPGASLSMQMHHHRAEHWVVVKGVAKVTNGETVSILNANQSTYIPLGVKHRLENVGDVDLEIIEVQSGDILIEEDIVRFEDIYGRN